MKKILLLITASLVFGCAAEEKKAAAPADAKATPAAAAATAKKGKGFPDEDISKMKPRAASSPAGEESTVSCKGSGDDVRTIAVVKADTGCKVDYTKSGNTQTIATAANDFSYCQEKSDKVRSNLEGSGFKCE